VGELKPEAMKRIRYQGAGGGSGGFMRGATQLRVLDVLTALILLAVLLWASWKQFPAYENYSSVGGPSAAPADSQRPAENP